MSRTIRLRVAEQSGVAAWRNKRNAEHAGSIGGLDTDHSVLDHRTRRMLRMQPPGTRLKDLGIWFSADHVHCGHHHIEQMSHVQLVDGQEDIGGRTGRAGGQAESGLFEAQ